MLLGLLFLLVAAFYASVGFGGGSSYLALLVLWDVPYAIIPIIALICNIVVVSGNSMHYARAGYANRKLLLPFVLPSVLTAYIGGRLLIEKETFVLILFFSLLAAGLRLLIKHRSYGDDPGMYRPIPYPLAVGIGAALGFLAGITGIGGGIFLAPVLYALRAAPPKHIAAAASLFILLNSIAGLFGQLQKPVGLETALAYWYLPLLVLVGGQIGNLMVIKFAPARIVALLTALMILFVAIRLGMHIK